MKTTTWLMILPLLCAVNGATADGMDYAGADAPAAEAAAAIDKAPARERMRAHTPTRLPSGDIRHCLDLKSNEAIIRCAETPRRKR